MAFSVTANVIPRVVAGKNIRSDIQKRLGLNKAFDVNVRIDPAAKSQLKSLGNQLTKIRTFSNNAGQGLSVFGAAKTIAGIGLVAAGIATIKRELKEGIKFLGEWNDSLIDLQIISGNSAEQLKGIERTTSAVARAFGVADKELLKTSITLKQAGFTLEQIEGLLPSIGKASLSPTFNDLNGIIETLIVSNEAFKLSVDESAQALSSIDALSAKYAVESDDLATAVSKAGGTFAQLGGDLNELLAIFATVRSTTRQESSSIANALNTIAVRLQRQSTENFLNELGVSLRDANNELLPLARQFEIVGEAFNKIPEKSPLRPQLVEVVAGVRQYSKLVPILTNLDKVSEAYNVTKESGNRLDEVAAAAQGKLSVQIQKTTNSYNELLRVVGEIGVVGGIGDFLSGLTIILETTVSLKDEFAKLKVVIDGVWEATGISKYLDILEQVLNVQVEVASRIPGVGGFINSGRKALFNAAANNTIQRLGGTPRLPQPQENNANNAGNAGGGGGQAFFSTVDDIPDDFGKAATKSIFEVLKTRIGQEKTFSLLGNEFGPLQELPGIIQRLNESELTGLELDKEIQRELEAFPDTIKNSVDSVADLTQISTLTTKLVSVLERDLDKLKANIEQRNALQSRNTSLRLGLAEIIGQRDNRDVSKDQLEILTGQKNATAKGLGKELTTRNANIANIESQLDTADAQTKAELIKQLNAEQIARDKAVKGLEFLADASARLSQIEDQKAKREQLRNATIAGFNEDTQRLRGSELRSRLQDIKAATKLAETGNINAVKGSRRSRAIDILQTFGNISLKEFGGKTGIQILEKLEENSARKGGVFNFNGVFPNRLDRAITRKDVFKEATIAQQALIKGNNQQQSLLPQANVDGLNQAAQAIQSSATQLSESVAKQAKAIEQASKAIPATIEMSVRGQVDVIFNGANVLAGLEPKFRELINAQIETGINKLIKDKFPNAGANYTLPKNYGQEIK